MSKTLTEIAQDLKDSNKKDSNKNVQLIYAFNGTGKTRLSRELKDLVAPKNNDADSEEQGENSRHKILYYNAFTEDLFYWDNDLELDAQHKLKIQRNSFTDWILKDQGQDQNITANFQNYANDKLTPSFNEEYETQDRDGKDIIVPAFSEVTFSLESGDDKHSENLKISKGEESNFIWSVFYTLLQQVISILGEAEVSDCEADQFNQLEYVFIDDPVSSLDENHLIELAVNLAGLIKKAPTSLKFIITTHSPLFYNVLYNELNKKRCYLLERFEDGTFALEEKLGDSNQSFSYHLHLKKVLEKAICGNQIEKYHFTILRNLYEKTANFLGYPKWSDLLPKDKDENNKEMTNPYYNRIIQFTSHSTLSNEEVAEPTDPEKRTVKFLFDNLIDNYGYWQEENESNG